MSISKSLYNQGQPILWRCSKCNRETEVEGQRVMAVKYLKCDGCGEHHPLGYEEKVKLFRHVAAA